MEDPASFPKWVYRIVSNKCADRVRRRQRQRDHVHESQEDILEAASEQTLPFAEDEIGRLREAMRQLSADRRAILSMFYVDGLSVAEIGEALAIPHGTVKSRLFHARNQLKHALEGARHEQQHR